jgi:hypothetical protein
MEFRVIWEIDIHADSPRQAVEEARAVQLRPDMPATVFEVWDYARHKMHRVDLVEAAGRLNTVEMASVRAAFRQLQCTPDLKPDLKDLVAVLLLFLDEEEGKARRR